MKLKKKIKIKITKKIKRKNFFRLQMHRRNDSKKNKMQIHIDRSVDLRDVRHSNNSPMSPYKLKLPSIF